MPRIWNDDELTIRNEILDHAMRGLLNPDDAEKEAAARGVGPFKKIPEPSQHDPMHATKSRWTFAQAFAWIAWRSIDQVGEWDSDYLAECLDFWPFDCDREKEITGWELRAPHPISALRAPTR
jgi:hypothetical protein